MSVAKLRALLVKNAEQHSAAGYSPEGVFRNTDGGTSESPQTETRQTENGLLRSSGSEMAKAASVLRHLVERLATTE